MRTHCSTSYSGQTEDKRKHVGHARTPRRKNDRFKKRGSDCFVIATGERTPKRPTTTRPHQTHNRQGHDTQYNNSEENAKINSTSARHSKDHNKATQVKSHNDVSTHEGIVTDTIKATWRQCLQEVRSINIPYANDIRPMKTRNAFVTKAVVFIAYLVVHAEDGKPIPKISGKFRLSPLRHNMTEMAKEIVNSGVDYIDEKFTWNGYVSADVHVLSCLTIGSWLANQLAKAKNHGTWTIIGNHVVGSTKGLYEPYKQLFEKVGIDVPMKAASI